MATRRVSGAARPAGYSVLSACRRHRQPEIALLPLVGDAENAGRSATTRCLQGIISSSCVPNHLAGVAVDTAEPPKSIDGEALPANASPHHHPLPAGEGHCQVAKVLVVDIRKSLIYHPQVRDGYRRTPVAGTCHDAPLLGTDVPLRLY
uniref:Uncharacterized protein n=1 Tax=Oryza sativa subsp. japonica TaxID=39947 RepID=Q6ZB15_ORYSJ|nr:hypothetical protein [Oryza sativa Japonica Group]